MRLLITVFLSLLCVSIIQAQHRISGMVLSNAEDFYVANVILLNEEGTEMVKGETTDNQGKFILDGISDGTYRLEVSALGFVSFTEVLTINGQDYEMSNISLEEDSQIIEGVSVVAKKPVFERKADRLIVNVQNAVSSAGANALDIISRSPGITVDRVNNAITLMGRTSVIVAINGKRSRLDKESLIQLLESTPSSNIKSIELINNPPSSYDADGDGGVINIVMIKGVDDGFNGNVNAFGGYGEREKFGGGVNFNAKVGKLNFYGDASTNNDFSNQNVTIGQEIQYDDRFINTEQFSRRPPVTRNHSARLGLDVDLASNVSLGTFIYASKRIWKMNAETTTDYEGDPNLSREILGSNESNETDHFMISNNLTFQLSETSKWSFDYDYLKYEIDNPTDYNFTRFGADGESIDNYTFSSSKLTPFTFNVFKTDFSSRLSNSIDYEIGAKATIAMIENDTELVNFNPEPVIDPFFTDKLNMDEDIYAAYASIRGKLSDNINVSAGTRFERYVLDLDSEFDGDIIDRDINRFFPNVNIEYSFSDMKKINVSYNQRVNRPGFQVLAPAFYFFDLNTVLSGNINARQTISRSVGMDITLNALFVNLSFTDENNPISWGQPDINNERNVLILAPRNFADRKLYNMSLSYPISFSEKWNARININSMYRKEIASVDDLEIDNSGFAHFGNFTTNYNAGRGWSLEGSGRFNSEVQVGLAVFQPRFSGNLGVQKTFANNSKLSFSWSDLFNTGSFFGIVTDRRSEGVYYDWNYEQEGNVLRVSYSMPFGNTRLKTKGPHTSGSIDEQNRANN